MNDTGRKEADMELNEGIRTRRSVRKFIDAPVPREIITQIVETARFAPSWKNTQTARYVVLDSRAAIDELAEKAAAGFAHNQEILKGAPAVAVITTVNGRSGYEKDGSFTTPKGNEWQMFDAGVAAQTFCLAAHSHGLGTVIMGIFREDAAKELLGLDDSLSVSALIAMGYPAAPPKEPSRKPVEEFLTFFGD